MTKLSPAVERREMARQAAFSEGYQEALRDIRDAFVKDGVEGMRVWLEANLTPSYKDDYQVTTTITVSAPMLKLGDVLVTNNAGNIKIQTIHVLDDCYEIRGFDWDNGKCGYARSRFIDATTDYKVIRD